MTHKREIAATSAPVNEEEWGPGSRWRAWHCSRAGTVCNLRQGRAQHVRTGAGGRSAPRWIMSILPASVFSVNGKMRSPAESQAGEGRRGWRKEEKVQIAIVDGGRLAGEGGRIAGQCRGSGLT